MRTVTAEEFAAREDLVPVPVGAIERAPKHWREVGRSADGQWAYFEGSACGREPKIEPEYAANCVYCGLKFSLLTALIFCRGCRAPLGESIDAWDWRAK